MLLPSQMSRRGFLGRSAAATVVAAAGAARLAPNASAADRTGPVNVRVSHDGLAMHGEPSVAANPRNPRSLLGTCIVSGSDVTQGRLATYASFDGGATWRSNGPLPGIPTTGIDPSAAFDAHGHGFVCGLVGSELQPHAAGAYVWRTEDGGRNFLTPVTAIAGVSDHPSLAADRWATSSPGTLYVATALNPGLAFTRSADGGRSFPPPVVLDAQAAGPVVTAGPGGVVCITYPVPVPPLSSGNALVRVITSTDHGVTFGPPADLLQMSVQPYFNLPAAAAATASGNIHVAVATYDNTTHQSELLLFSSRDLGGTWAVSARLASSDQVIYLQPELAVDDRDRVAVSAFASNHGHVDVLLFISEPCTARFGPPLRVTSRPFEMSLGADGHWIGDYQGLTATPGAFHPFWNDTRTGHLEIFTATVQPP